MRLNAVNKPLVFGDATGVLVSSSAVGLPPLLGGFREPVAWRS
jgi:hypothetical protein